MFFGFSKPSDLDLDKTLNKVFISDSGDLFSIVVISSKKMVRCTFFKFNMFYVSFDNIVEDNNNLKRIYLLETSEKARQTCIVR